MRWFFVVSLLLILLSCGKNVDDKEYVRSLAIENMVDDFYPINWIIRYYARSYYTMPKDYEELLSFIKDCKENDYYFSEVEKASGYDIIKTISNTKVIYASFNDSAFFYLPDYNMGSCVIGTPCLWLKSPKTYPELAPRYETIPPSAFNTSGKFIFNLDYSSIENYLIHLSEKQGKQIFYQNQEMEMIPLKVLFIYDTYTDSLSISSNLPPNEFLFYRNSIRHEDYRSVGSNFNINHYLQRIAPEIKSFFTDKEEIAKVFFVTDIFENTKDLEPNSSAKQ
ncbi:MAG: hypothetical protein IJJ72_07885 [Bacteroidales bacterium]|nr:hypothetical protein [Bacteroidales bacterium]MBR0500897.1 hypothetical protein [Bacteroidales bacterium]